MGGHHVVTNVVCEAVAPTRATPGSAARWKTTSQSSTNWTKVSSRQVNRYELKVIPVLRVGEIGELVSATVVIV